MPRDPLRINWPVKIPVVLRLQPVGHNLQRLELLLTEKQKQGWSMGEIQRQTGLSEKGIEKTMKMMDEIYLFEERLKKL